MKHYRIFETVKFIVSLQTFNKNAKWNFKIILKTFYYEIQKKIKNTQSWFPK